MTTRTFNITALSPLLQYDPPQDVPNSVWKSDSGGITLGNLDSGAAGRILMGTGSVTMSAFGSGLSFAGSITGTYCTYSAAISPGPGNPLSSSSSSSSALPANQTASPSTGMLASFTGLTIGNWELVLTGNCDNGSGIKVTEAVLEGWVGVAGSNVTVNTLDDTDPSLSYSGVDWSTTRGLQARFYDDTQHYTSSSKASMNYTFSGSAIVVWASMDNQHGPYAASLHYSSSTYDSRNTLYSSGYNPFLAVPVPYLLVTGLDPGQSYTLVLQNKATNGTYLDLDYIQVYTADGGAPPDGGTAAVHALDSGGGGGGGGLAGLGLGGIIGIAVGAGVVVVLFIGVIWWCWRRRKMKVDRAGGTRPLDIAHSNPNSTPGHHHHVIPLTMHGNVLPIPFHPLTGSGHSPEHSMHAAERQGLLYGGYGGGGGGGGGRYPSPPSTGMYPSPPSTGMPMAYSPPSSSSGYDPYANYGGGYPSPHSSSHIGLNNTNTGIPTDPVQARRQGKAAELDAARERAAAMRVQNNNNNSGVVMSPTTPGNNNTHSTITQSWDASSHGPSSPGPNSNSNPGGDVKMPDEPPPSYDPTG